ncbi:hypothetical protein N566_00105 [Streptomycetaceae bacterium MP113-05]|nr:hypothetical protein N566_00105 [Streptomycetaceae bacterium MP113-05]
MATHGFTDGNAVAGAPPLTLGREATTTAPECSGCVDRSRGRLLLTLMSIRTPGLP